MTIIAAATIITGKIFANVDHVSFAIIILVEVGGIEPPSESILTGTSPGAGGRLHSLIRAQAAMLGDSVAS